MDLKILQDCELGEAGKKCQLPAKSACRFIEQKLVEPYTPPHRPRSGRDNTTIHQPRIFLTQTIEGLGEAGSVIRCNGIEAAYLIQEKCGVPERLVTDCIREMARKNSSDSTHAPTRASLALA